jgi:hypothetical protein
MRCLRDLKTDICCAMETALCDDSVHTRSPRDHFSASSTGSGRSRPLVLSQWEPFKFLSTVD